MKMRHVAAITGLTLLLTPTVKVLAQGMEGHDPPISAAGASHNNAGLTPGPSTPGGGTPAAPAYSANPGNKGSTPTR